MDDHPFSCIDLPVLLPKPRSAGVTALLDKGIGVAQARDLVSTAGDLVDVIKLGWGSARMHAPAALRDKVAVYRDGGIKVCTGGTFFELAFAQDRVAEFLAAARDLGIEMVEVSNGVHPMSDDDKAGLISTARDAGFMVWSEVGKKDPEEDARLTISDRIAAAERELAAGSDKVVLEARESGNIGIYDKSGNPAIELLDRIADQIGVDRLVFEAPRKAQQVWMIRHFGPTVNLGNVPITEAIPLGTLRTGLRGDTFADFHLHGVEVFVELGVNGALAARKRGGVVVVIDALRASATVVTALASGMRAVKIVATPGECVGEVTAGERGGSKLAQVDHGNSPTELLGQPYAGKQLTLTTTNGAEVLLTATAPSTDVLVGTTLNANAVAAAATRLAEARGCSVTLLKAGRNNRDAIEDALAAGEILRAMRGVRLHGAAPPTSSVLESEFASAESGLNLAALGYSKDVHFCAQVDLYDVVPHLENGLLVPL